MKKTFLFHIRSLLICCLLGGLTPLSFGLEIDKVFPDSTKGYFSITDARQFAELWSETAFGQLMQRPDMREFAVDLRKQISSQVSVRFGLTLDDIRTVPSGEIAGGLVAPVGQVPGFVLVMNIAGKENEAKSLAAKLDAIFAERKITKSSISIIGENATVYKFPELEDDPTERRAVYLRSGDYLIVADQIYLVELIAKRIKGEKDAPLSEEPGYQAVMRRCEADRQSGDAEPMVRWFIQPLQYGEAVRSIINLPEKLRARTSIFTVLSEAGLDALLGIGGTVALKSGELDVVHRMFIYAPKPHREAMQMFVFPNTTDFSVPKWVPGDVAAGTCLNFDPLAAFDHFGPLFDAIVMQGEKGAWEDVVRSMKEDPYGKQIDLREEFVRYLGTGIIMTSRYRLPITTESENLFVAIPIRDGKVEEMHKALATILEGDPDFEQREFQGFTFWQSKPFEEVQRIDIKIGPGVPSLVPNKATPANQAADRLGAEKEVEPFFPRGGVAIGHGHLLLTNNVEYLEEILSASGSPTGSFEDNPEFLKVREIFALSEIGNQPRFLQSFSKTADVIRPTYELLRQGKMPQSKSVLGQVLNRILTPPDLLPGERPAKIDGSKMPEFETIKDHFGTAALFGVTEETGWFLKGFSVPKQ